MNDFVELDRLAADLTKAGIRASLAVRPILEHAAQRIEDTAKDLAPRTNLPHYAETINHDVSIGPAGGLEAEIGPDRSVNGQAKLANIFEFGTSKMSPRPHLGPALDRETPVFIESIENLGGTIL